MIKNSVQYTVHTVVADFNRKKDILKTVLELINNIFKKKKKINCAKDGGGCCFVILILL